MNPDAIFLCLFITLFIIGGIFIAVSSLTHPSRALESQTNFSSQNPCCETSKNKRIQSP